jgi:hypothetical protein
MLTGEICGSNAGFRMKETIQFNIDRSLARWVLSVPAAVDPTKGHLSHRYFRPTYPEKSNLLG